MREVIRLSFLSAVAIVVFCFVVYSWMSVFRKIQRQKDFTDKIEIVQILEENYRTIGTSDPDALVAIYDDIAAGYFLENLEEWSITESQLHECVRILRKKMKLEAEVY